MPFVLNQNFRLKTHTTDLPAWDVATFLLQRYTGTSNSQLPSEHFAAENKITVSSVYQRRSF